MGEVAVDLGTAYRACERVTRRRAGNFYYGIRLLPGPKRRALCSVYAMARRIDDIGDGPLPPEEKLQLLAAVRADLDRLDPGAPDPVLSALGDVRRRVALPVEAFGDLIAGVEMDVRGTTYRTFADLEVYCRRVAGSIGRLSVAVFGASDVGRATALADDLGVAMQLTNILRDLGEDLAAGRVYLPAEDRERFGWQPGGADGAGENLGPLVRFEALRARQWFARGLELLPLLDGRSAACVGAMTGIYRRILDRIERCPAAALERRVSLPPWEKAWVAAASLAPRPGRVPA
jgi:phytoene synthase